MAPPILSLPFAIVTVLSVLLGIFNMMKQSGSVFGIATVPSTWLPYFTLASTFTGGVVSYFTGLNPLVISGASVFYATIAGITALLAGAASGLALHAHLVVPQMALQARKTARAAAAATLALLVIVLVSCQAVNSIIDTADAECETLTSQPDANGLVTLVCEVLNTTGDVIQFFEVKQTPAEAAKFLAAHPVKVGHKSPRALATEGGVK